MKIRTKITSLILSAIVSVLFVNIAVLSLYPKDIRSNTLQLGDTLTNAASEVITAYFDARKAEISTYANIPLVRTMDWQNIKPFLINEQKRLRHYEKMLLGLANEDAHYYITTEGNPYFGGLASHDNTSPTARLRTIKKRDYWLSTVGDNHAAEPRTFISNPIISYVTGVKQVIIASTVLSDDRSKVLGMIGGSLDWNEMERLFMSVQELLFSNFYGAARFFIVSRDGTYFYHFDKEKSLHLKTDEKGVFVLNEIGEKIEVGHKITEEMSPGLVEAGMQLLAKRHGHVLLADPDSSSKEYLFYQPIAGTDLGLGIVVPEQVVLDALYPFYRLILLLASIALAVAVLVAVLVGKAAVKPIEKTSTVATDISEGNINTRLNYHEDDELGGLAKAFNKMVDEQQKQIEHTKEAHQRLLTILDGIDAIIYVSDMKTYELLYVNQYVKDIFGDITGRICWQAIAEQSGPCPFCTNSYLINEDGFLAKPYTWEFRNTDNHRTYLCVDRAIKWVDGRIVRLEIATDITANKDAERQLKKLAAVIEHSDAAVFLCDKNTQIEYINKAGRDMLSIGGNSDIAPYSLVSFLSSQEQQDITKAIANTQEWHGVAQLLHSGGKAIPVEVNAFVVLDENNSFVCMAVVARDITQKLKKEEELRQAQKMEAIGTLAGGIAHDFNNILMALMGYAELTIELCKQKGDEKLLKYLDHILKSSERAAALVKQILTFSRKLDTSMMAIQLQPLVKETIKMLRNTIPATIAMTSDIDPRCRMVLADAGQIQQVLMNLCVNAVYAMGEKGRLKVTLTQVRLVSDNMQGVHDLAPGDYVRLSVEDDGCGMTPDVLSRIFEPYFTTKPVGKGTGLGLATVLGIVKKHKGEITVASEKDKGSRFDVYLPTVSEEGVIQNGDGGGDSGGDLSRFRAMKKNVLLVDDEAPIRDVLSALLTDIGWSYEVCTSGLEGLRAFEKEPERFNFIITDYSMPEMSGLEMMQKIRASKKDITLLLISGYNAFVDEENSSEVEINYYLKKPFSRRQFYDALNELFPA